MISTQTGVEPIDPPKKKAPTKKKASPKKKVTKNENKNIRAPLGAEESPHKMSKEDEVRSVLGKQPTMDWNHYLTRPEYKNMTLFGCLDIEMDTWIQAGAEPVKKQAKSRKIFPGINDTVASDYEYKVTGADEWGKPTKTYLMFIPKDEYIRLKVKPLQDRNDAIQRSMGAGKPQNNGETVMGHVGGIELYAPSTDVGGRKIGSGSRGLSTVTNHSEDTHEI